MTTVTISLRESLKTFIDHQMATKGYRNVSEYFRSLLGDAQKEEEDARLETLLLEGLAGGEDIPLTKEFWKDLKAEALGIAEKHKSGSGRDSIHSPQERKTTSSGNCVGIWTRTHPMPPSGS
jgi:antitoxin ParD1/3/4